MKKLKCKYMKCICYILSLCMFLSLIPNTLTALYASEKSNDIVILYTNDIHTYIDGELSYDVLSGIKSNLQTQYNNVLLVDAGDHIQGTAYGSMDKGETIIDLMNATGYDVATLGNHEFDYGMDGCMDVIEYAEFPYISCNFYHEENGVRQENVLDSYVLFECGDEVIAFVGITTPETFTKSTPAYFQNDSGEYVYGISGGTDGAELYKDVQKAINDAKAEGATKIIALGHLGDEMEAGPWTSELTIANVNGLDAFIDGHSHSVIEEKTVTDKAGENVLLTQTGEYFHNIGMMVIDSETGDISTGFYTDTISLFDENVKNIKDEWILEVDELLNTNIGSTTVVFDNYNTNGNRLVRMQETNTGDFCADALYYLFDSMDMDVDVAIMNGGGIRNTAVTGELSYKTCKQIHTFGNVACLQTVTGQQVLDALEWGARFAGEGENGGFLQVSGITYKIDCTIEDTTQKDDKGVWIGGPTGEYRVYDVMIYNKETDSMEELVLDGKYNLAGYNYTLRDLGDGFNMFNNAVNVIDYVMEDYMVLSNYVNAFENGVVQADNSPISDKYSNFVINYDKRDGCGRIEVNEYGKDNIVIGGLDNDIWFSKYGNVYLNCKAEDFVNKLGFEIGDIVKVSFLNEELELPVVPDYSYVDSSKPAVIVHLDENNEPVGYVSLAINMGNFAEYYKIATRKTEEDGTWCWEAYEEVEFPVGVTFDMKKENGYDSEILLRQLTFSIERSDYFELSDEEYANFREIITTGIGNGLLYRTSSPINPEINRNKYALEALEKAGVTVIMNLADNVEEAGSYDGFSDSYYAKQKVIYLNLGVDFNSEEFKSGLAEGLRFFANNKGVYAIHCTHGKDRAGFVSAIIECLMGASYNEIVEDYMLSYYNYYNVKSQTDKYDAIAESNIIKSLCIAFGVEDLKGANLSVEAEEYLISIGLSTNEISNLKANLSDMNSSIDSPDTYDNNYLDYVYYLSILAISSLVFMCKDMKGKYHGKYFMFRPGNNK